MILVAERAGFLGNLHEPWKEIIKPTVHQLVETAQPGGDVLFEIMIVDDIERCPDLVTVIKKSNRRLISVPSCACHNFESTEEKVFLNPERVSLCNINQIQ